MSKKTILWITGAAVFCAALVFVLVSLPGEETALPEAELGEASPSAAAPSAPASSADAAGIAVPLPEADFASVAELRGGGEHEAGDRVTTAGYYAAGDGGGAAYLLGTKRGSEPLIIPVGGGLTAELVVEDEMSVLQFGAVNDGETDSRLQIQAALSSRASVLTFPRDGRLMVRGDLRLGIGKRLSGNGCTLLTDDGYQGSAIHFFQIRDAAGFEWDSLNIEALQTKALLHSAQLGIYRASDVTISDSQFIGPDVSVGEDGGYYNISLYAEWENVSIDSCLLDIPRGGDNLQARNADNDDEISGLAITGNELRNTGGGVLLALGDPDDIFTGVTVRGNRFYARGGPAGAGGYLVSLSPRNNGSLSDAVIEENSFDAQADQLFLLRSMGENVTIRNNEISFLGGAISSSGSLFHQDIPGSSPVVISGNTLRIDNTGAGKVSGVFRGIVDARENHITVDGDLPVVFTRVANAEGNTVEISGALGTFAYESVQVSGNMVTAGGAINTVFRMVSISLAETAVLSGNTVTANGIGGSPSLFLHATNLRMNGFRIEVLGNIISIPYNSAPSRSDSRNFVYSVHALEDGAPVKEYPEGDAPIDVSGMGNLIYISADNDFSSSLNMSYLRGGVRVISYFQDSNVQQPPEVTDE